ncbi:MAG: hypothetical protein DRN12_03785 [Thermoplasmata archaeon]|nr:MAG: hypothetical protein DRN12_03785 [Thermoplasmata archaeon]
MAEVLYLYPQIVRVSFTNVAEQHIAQLQKCFDVDVQEIKHTYLIHKHYKIIATHPVFWVFTHPSPLILDARLGELERIRQLCNALIGFDVADSDRIAQYCADLLNEYYDCIVLPSNASAEAYYKSGVNIDVHVIPHGIDERLLSAKPALHNIYNFDLRLAHAQKEQLGYKYVLFFLWHSGYRKGADIVAKAMQIVQKECNDVLLLLKLGEIGDPFIRCFSKVKHIAVKGWLTWHELAFLYQLADVVVCPSRGGGFELNAIEALAFGKPVIAHAHGCFADYAQWLITCKAKYCNTVIPNNHIHIGGGYEVDAEDMAGKILKVLDNYDRIADRYSKIAFWVRQKYNWMQIGKQLCRLFSNYLRNSSMIS